MITKNICIFGVLFALLTTFGMCDRAFAQNSSKSDTISLLDPKAASGFAIRDFGSPASPIPPDSTVCHTIFVENKSGMILVLADVQAVGCNWTPIPKLPFVLLPNEIVSFMNVCFTGANSTVGTVNGFVRINYYIDQKNYDMIASMVGYQIADSLLNKPCVEMTLDSSSFGPIIMDGDISHTITIKSNRHDSMAFYLRPDSVNADFKSFHVTGINLPYTLKPLEVKTFAITYSPRSNVPIVKYRQIAYLTFAVPYCNIYNLGFQLAGVAIPPTADSISTPLAAGSTDVLAMISDNSVTTKTFHFTNTGTTNLKITGVSLLNGKSFAITNITPSNTLPFTLTPGQSMSVTIAMTTTNNGVYYDEVIITAEQGIISMDFQLQGLRKNGTPADVRQTSGEQHLAIYPNPSHGGITVDLPGIKNAEIEVLDLLGRVITKETASEKWIWKSNKPSGTYILHVNGSDDKGNPFQSYDRFIIE